VHGAAAITENKHLSAVSHIKDAQDKAATKHKIKPVSNKNGYVKTGRRPPRRPSKMESYHERKQADHDIKDAETGQIGE